MEVLDAATVTDIREFAKPNCAKDASGFNFEVQQNIVNLRPIRGEMFIESATSTKVFLAPLERKII
jgi:hypothetical protein